MTNAEPQQATADEIRRYLAGLKQDNPRLFLRVCDAAHGGRRPMDTTGELRNPEHIVLTGEDGNWHPGYAQAIAAMTELDPYDEDNMSYLILEEARPKFAEAA